MRARAEIEVAPADPAVARAAPAVPSADHLPRDARLAATGARPRCTRLRSDPPITLRETAAGVRLVGSGAGPVGGDDLALAVRVGDGAELDLAAVAASLVLPGTSGEPSRHRLDVTVGDGARLRLSGAPTVLVRGCDHEVSVQVRLGTAASFLWRDEVVLGRHDEPGGSLLQRVAVDVGGLALWRSDLAVGPRWPGSGSGAVLGGARAVGSLLLVGPGAAELAAAPMPAVEGARLAVSPLDGPGALVTALASSGGRLATALDAVLDALGARAPCRTV